MSYFAIVSYSVELDRKVLLGICRYLFLTVNVKRANTAVNDAGRRFDFTQSTISLLTRHRPSKVYRTGDGQIEFDREACDTSKRTRVEPERFLGHASASQLSDPLSILWYYLGCEWDYSKPFPNSSHSIFLKASVIQKNDGADKSKD
jgi:hypothetical protein